MKQVKAFGQLLFFAAVIGLFVSIMCQLSGHASATKEEEEEIKRLQLLSKLRKKIFTASDMSPDDALKVLQNLREAYGDTGLPRSNEPVINLSQMIEYANVTEEKCNQVDKVIEMRQMFSTIENFYPGLVTYLGSHFKAQFELCGFHVKYREDFDRFKRTHKKSWLKMNKFKDRVAKFGKIHKNWKNDKLDNPIQMNEAFTDLYEETKKSSPSGGDYYLHRGEAAKHAYNEMYDIVQGSKMFGNEVSPAMHLAKYHPEARNDEELKDGLRHDNVYGQITRTNFAPSMGSMFADAYYDRGDQAWQAYLQWQEMNNMGR